MVQGRSAGIVRCVLAVAVVVTPAASARPVRASENDPRREAEALFREGRRATTAHEYATACAKFAESQALDPSTGTVLNLGDCEEHLGHLLAARSYYQTALAQLGAGDRRIRYASLRLEALEERLPRLTIGLPPAAPDGLTVARDAASVSPTTMGIAVPVDPGEHVIVVTAPGCRERRETVFLKERESRQVIASPGEIEDVLGAGAPLPPPKHPPEPARWPPASIASSAVSPARTVGWIAGGLGAAGLSMAVVSGVALLRDESTVMDAGHCNANKQCDAAGLAAASHAKTWLPINTVSWAVAVAGLGLSTYLLFSTASASSNRAVVLNVGLVPGLRGAAGGVSGRF